MGQKTRREEPGKRSARRLVFLLRQQWERVEWPLRESRKKRKVANRNPGLLTAFWRESSRRERLLRKIEAAK